MAMIAALFAPYAGRNKVRSPQLPFRRDLSISRMCAPGCGVLKPVADPTLPRRGRLLANGHRSHFTLLLEAEELVRSDHGSAHFFSTARVHPAPRSSLFPGKPETLRARGRASITGGPDAIKHPSSSDLIGGPQ